MTATANEEDTARAESYLIEYNHHACHITEFGAAPEVATPRPSDVRALAAKFAAVRAPLEARIAELAASGDRLAFENVALAAKARLIVDTPRTEASVDAQSAIAELEREIKAAQEYAAVAHQNGLDTYQAERTALLERIAELEADFASIERIDAALAVEELAAEANAARAMAVMRAAEQYCEAHRDRSPGGEALLRERYAALEAALAPSTPGPATGALAQGSRLWRCAEALAAERDQLARQDAECNRLVAAVREDTIAKAREALCKLAEDFFRGMGGGT